MKENLRVHEDERNGEFYEAIKKQIRVYESSGCSCPSRKGKFKSCNC